MNERVGRNGEGRRCGYCLAVTFGYSDRCGNPKCNRIPPPMPEVPVESTAMPKEVIYTRPDPR